MTVEYYLSNGLEALPLTRDSILDVIDAVPGHPLDSKLGKIGVTAWIVRADSEEVALRRAYRLNNTVKSSTYALELSSGLKWGKLAVSGARIKLPFWYKEDLHEIG